MMAKVSHIHFRFGLRAAAALLAATVALAPLKAFALSEIPREDVPLPDDQGRPDRIEREQLPPLTPDTGDAPAVDEETGTDIETGEEAKPPADESETVNPPPVETQVPLPDPVVIPRDPAPSDSVEPGEEADVPVPDILYDVEVLPEPVRRMRTRIMEACLTGDIEQLRPLISGGEDGTQLSFASITGDPIEFLKNLSGDDEGQEILAILYEVLAAGFVHVDEGTASEAYVWPYFFAVPLQELDKRQRVELFKIVTAGDYEDMKSFGAYIFYRVGISPEGRWVFFVAGD
jgi:hypothetical protein